MSYRVIQQNGVVSREEMTSFVSMADCKDSVLCPKPHLVVNTTTCFNDPSRSLRWHIGHQAEISDAKAGSELDIILSKGGQGPGRTSSQIASSPPVFCGTPPSRVSNPLIQDARFRGEKKPIPPFSPLFSSPILSTPGLVLSTNYSSSRKGGCIRANFGNNPSVRIEGFDLNCSIPTLA